MYKNNYSHNNSSRSGYRNSGAYAKPRGGFGRRIKKLDPMMFVNKIVNTEIEQDNKDVKNLSSIDFAQYNIVEKLKRNIADHGYTTATEIQSKAIPEILAGRDVIGRANTGTGKTAAFLISLINKAFNDRNQRVLIVVPTRELATQIVGEFKMFARGTDLNCALLVGGANMKRQIYSLSHNPHFVIGTPGRIKDLVGRKALKLFMFQNVVLDEVDRMVDIGFINEIKMLISLLPRIRQSLFFSATVDKKTEEILQNFVRDPVTINVKQQSQSENIEQDVIKINGHKSKTDVLYELLVQSEFQKVIVFGRTKWGINKLAYALQNKGVRSAVLHGNKSQSQRERALREFKENKLKVLLATDVASRGIDVSGVTHVINYDAPETYEDYIHRIGRTGRAGKRGVALTFVE